MGASNAIVGTLGNLQPSDGEISRGAEGNFGIGRLEGNILLPLKSLKR